MGSPSSKFRSGLHESISASKLYRELSPTRVFTATTDESRVSLPDLFKQRNGLQSLRPAYSNEPVPNEDDDGNKMPKLLQR